MKYSGQDQREGCVETGASAGDFRNIGNAHTWSLDSSSTSNPTITPQQKHSASSFLGRAPSWRELSRRRPQASPAGQGTDVASSASSVQLYSDSADGDKDRLGDRGGSGGVEAGHDSSGGGIDGGRCKELRQTETIPQNGADSPLLEGHFVAGGGGCVLAGVSGSSTNLGDGSSGRGINVRGLWRNQAGSGGADLVRVRQARPPLNFPRQPRQFNGTSSPSAPTSVAWGGGEN